MKATSSLTLFLCLFAATIFAQPVSIYNDDPEQRVPLGFEKPAYGFIDASGKTVDRVRVEPPNWWVGMNDPILELLIYDANVRDLNPRIQYPGVVLQSTTRLQNPNYLFLKLHIEPGTKPGQFNIELMKGETVAKSYPYRLDSRKRDEKRIQGLDNSDLIYLILPDRFANGDPSNDSFDAMNQVGINRDKMFFRHGGDLEGVLDRLDYLEDLGVTALWLNPVLENDQHYESYHGYAITDHYQIDPRFGSNEDYLKLVEACHARGMKVIMDIIHNHTGDQHWFIRDLPDVSWIHQHKEFIRTTYRAPTLMDPYAAQDDVQRMSNGWFDNHMPDLNQQHPQLATYLIQNNLWWTEYSGHDAYRIDTYAYPDQQFMADWGMRMQLEHPKLSFFGETWVHGPAVQAQFTQNNNLRKGYNSHLPAVTDFQLYYAINEALNKPQGWTDGAARLYFTMAQDFLYEDPYRNVVFLDNHDLSRIFSVMGEDMRKFKSSIAWLFTTRGIPMLYYGTEILMKNFDHPDGKVREDFPGGWSNDPVNKFGSSGRNAMEQEAFEYIRGLAKFRKETPALHRGKLTQFVPENGIYVYCRQHEDQRILVVMNTNNETRTITTERYRECIGQYSTAKAQPGGEMLESLSELTLEPYTTLILELQ